MRSDRIVLDRRFPLEFFVLASMVILRLTAWCRIMLYSA
jgi:hypothetical protein